MLSQQSHRIEIEQKEATARALMLRARALQTPAGPEHDALLKEARACEAAAHKQDFVDSAWLQPPTRLMA